MCLVIQRKQQFLVCRLLVSGLFPVVVVRQVTAETIKSVTVTLEGLALWMASFFLRLVRIDEGD